MKKKQLLPTFLAILFIAFVWQLIARQIGYPAIFPSLIDLGKQIITLFNSDDFFLSVSTTVLRGIIGFVFAFVIAFIFGTIALFSTFWKNFFHPIIVIARSIPVISFVLIAILWFSPPYLPVFIALITMFPILYQNILTGLEQTDIKWLEMAKVFGKSPAKRFFSIYLPASKSFIFDGISTAMGFGWRAIIIGEVLAQPIHGIGTSMKKAQAFINVSELIAWTVIAVGVSYLFEYFFRFIRNIRLDKKLPKPKPYELSDFPQTFSTRRIGIENVTKKFSQKVVFDSLSVSFNAETVNCIKGSSGKGKTTLLRMLADIEKTDGGNISFVKPGSIAYSFQDIRTLPWLTVTENISFVVSKNVDKQKVSNLVAYLLEKMELSDQGQKYPHELSGGQQQRVGLARALAARSDVLLLDEPLTGLDAPLKIRIIDFLSVWIGHYQPLVVWATHENVELHDLKIREVVF
ncbi:MAG: ATP-binding cassette domain-containing protein [Paludibacter sp.]